MASPSSRKPAMISNTWFFSWCLLLVQFSYCYRPRESTLVGRRSARRRLAYPAPTMSDVLRGATFQMQGSEGKASIPASPELAHAMRKRAFCPPCCTSRRSPARESFGVLPATRLQLKPAFFTRTTSANRRAIRSTPQMRTGNSTLSRGSLRRSVLAESRTDHRSEF